MFTQLHSLVTVSIYCWFSILSQNVCVTAAKFIAHLVNQQILHEIVALELLTVLLDEANDDTVEVAVGFMKVQCTALLVTVV